MKRVDGPTRVPEDGRPDDGVAVVRFQSWTELTVTWMREMPPTLPWTPRNGDAPAHRSAEPALIVETPGANGTRVALALGTVDGPPAGDPDPTGADGRHWADQGL